MEKLYIVGDIMKLTFKCNNSYDEVIRILNKTLKKPFFTVSSIFYKDEFLGIIKSNKFWIRKTRSKHAEGYVRAFYGKVIVDNNNNVIITGKFHLMPKYKISCILFFIVMDLMFIHSSIKTGIDIGSVIINILILIFIRCAMLFSKKEEKDVIDFLKSL